MSSAAETFLTAWVGKCWISDSADYPAAPKNVAELYEIYLSLERHPLAERLGGLGGYKLGAIGAEGEACLYAPLFKKFLLDASVGPVEISVGELQMFNVEAEIGVILGADIPATADGRPHTKEDVWASVESVRPCIECCGRRATPSVADSVASSLGKMADCLSAGGVVFGGAVDPKSSAWASCKCSLEVAGSTVAEGSGAECPLGGPQEALTYLANHLNTRGLSLKKGQFVITGATCKSKAFAIGDLVAADISSLGRVEAKMAP